MFVISVNHGEEIVGDFRDEVGAETHLQTGGWILSADAKGKLWTGEGERTARVLPVKRSLSELEPSNA